MSRIRSMLVIAAVTAAICAAFPVGAAVADTPAQAGSQKCPLAALKKAKGPVEITFWHSALRANEDTLKRLTDQFNSSQTKVKVNLVNQNTYNDTLTKYVAGLSTGDLPDLVHIQETDTQQMVDTGTVLAAGACAKADKYSFSDYLPRVADYFKVGGTLEAMPFSISNPVLFYDKKAFTKAGLDPEKPPASFAEVKADAQKLKDSGASAKAGLGLKVDPWFFEQWLAKANVLFANSGNGRKGRASNVVFNGRDGLATFTFMSDMVKSGLAVTNPYLGNSAFDDLLGIGAGNQAMAIDTSASLGTIYDVLGSGQYPNVEIGVGPMPGPTGPGGVSVGGGGLFISNKSSPEKQAAAWEYEKFLDSPESQAAWAAGTGYLPIRKSAAALKPVQDLWAARPGYKVAYDQIAAGPNTLATAGPVIGAFPSVREIIVDAENSMFIDGASPKAALKAAKKKADAAIADYNQRIGA